MFIKKEHSQIIGKPEIDSSMKAIDKVVTFLDTYLPKFPFVYKNKTTKTQLTHEDDVSQTLSIYLNRQVHKNNLFFIHFQYHYLKTRRSSDFGILAIEDNNPNDVDSAFFVIEAKWLPLPKLDKNREKEYVIGNPDGGGIERFKRGNHGAGLAKSAMVAYIQSENCPHWFTKVNGWIQDLMGTSVSSDILWNSDDLLVFQNQFDTTFKYRSTNTRIHKGKTDEIQLVHYWLPIYP
jgi:hypothetical protein